MREVKLDNNHFKKHKQKRKDGLRFSHPKCCEINEK